MFNIHQNPIESYCFIFIKKITTNIQKNIFVSEKRVFCTCMNIEHTLWYTDLLTESECMNDTLLDYKLVEAISASPKGQMEWWNFFFQKHNNGEDMVYFCSSAR